jgi:hypothetical protein
VTSSAQAHIGRDGRDRRAGRRNGASERKARSRRAAPGGADAWTRARQSNAA